LLRFSGFNILLFHVLYAFIECQKIIFFLLLEVFFASAKFPRLMDKCVCVFLTQ
jgi:hypothetical protein